METQRKIAEDLDTLIKMFDQGGTPEFSRAHIIREISVIYIEEKNLRAEGYLRNLLNDSEQDDLYRVAVFYILTRKILPTGLASLETLNALSAFEGNSTNAYLLAMLPK